MPATVKVFLQSTRPYSSSRYHGEKKKAKELDDAFEERIWREKCHFTDKGEVYIPAQSFTDAIIRASEHDSQKVPGKGQATWSKHFASGVRCVSYPGLMLGIKKDKVSGIWLPCHADGKRTCGRRVLRCFPVIPQWEGEVEFGVFDSIITEDIFRHYLVTAGLLIGIGRWRPQNKGNNGTFALKDVRWQDV